MKCRLKKRESGPKSHSQTEAGASVTGSGLGPVPWGTAEASAHLSVISPGETALPLHLPHPAGPIWTEKGLAGADLRSSKGPRREHDWPKFTQPLSSGAGIGGPEA